MRSSLRRSVPNAPTVLGSPGGARRHPRADSEVDGRAAEHLRAFFERCGRTHTKDTRPFVIQPILNIRLYLDTSVKPGQEGLTRQTNTALRPVSYGPFFRFTVASRSSARTVSTPKYDTITSMGTLGSGSAPETGTA